MLQTIHNDYYNYNDNNDYDDLRAQAAINKSSTNELSTLSQHKKKVRSTGTNGDSGRQYTARCNVYGLLSNVAQPASLSLRRFSRRPGISYQVAEITTLGKNR